MNLDVGITLIVAILVLGGLLATLGDRIGTKVGKARLSLFNLRPRKTAVLITIVTGILISASTLGILFASSEPLRRGVFEYDETQRKLRTARKQLDAVTEQKARIEAELAQARAQQVKVEQNLAATNQSLQTAIAEQQQTEAQLNQTTNQLTQVQHNFRKTQTRLQDVISNYDQAQQKLTQVSQQAQRLRSEITNLQQERQQSAQQLEEVKQRIAQRDRDIAERNQQIAQRNQQIAQRDREVVERDRVIVQREERLKELEDQQTFLERQVSILERYYQDYQSLREGNLAVVRGQILASGVVRIVSPEGVQQAIDQLLRQANRVAVTEVTRPGSTDVDQQVIQIPTADVEQLSEKIRDGREYLVRILSAGNYVRGETEVRVFGDAVLNQVVFRPGEVVAGSTADATTMTEEQILERIDLLIESSKFRARRAGILGNTTIQIADGNPADLVRFVQQIRDYQQPLEIKAVVKEVTYTSGPLKMELIAVQNGQVLFRT